MDLNKAIKERRSVRLFSPKKPNWRRIIEAIDASRYAPMAGKNCSIKIILVDEPEKIQQIAQATQQDFVSKVHYIVVFCTSKKRTVALYGDRGEKYAKQQAGAAMENFMLAVREKGLETCWVGDFVDDQIKRILKIPDEVDVEAVFPVGYESTIKEDKSAPRKKIELDNILYFNKYKNQFMRPKKNLGV